MHQVVKWIACPVTHGKLWDDEPSKRLVIYDVHPKQSGHHIIQALAYCP